MCWKEQGGLAILTFYALLQSNLFDCAWEMLGTVYCAAVQPPKNVIPFFLESIKIRQWLIYISFNF